MRKSGGFFKAKAAGFWMFILAAVLALVESGLYFYFYNGDVLLRYYVAEAALIPLAGVAASLLVAAIKPIGKWAPFVLFAAEMMAFCVFVNGTYMYLSSIFFGGISMEAFASIDIGFTACVGLFLAVLLLSAVALFMKQEKVPKAQKAEA